MRYSAVWLHKKKGIQDFGWDACKEGNPRKT